jgi:hypothetical protein
MGDPATSPVVKHVATRTPEGEMEHGRDTQILGLGHSSMALVNAPG